GALTVDNNANGPLPALAQVTGVITNQPHISKGSKGSRSVHIALEQYPQFDFVIKRPEYDAMLADDYINYVSPYDTLQLMIEEDDFLMKLTKTKEPSFEKKHAWYSHIEVYGLQDSSRSYLTPAGIINNQGDHIGMVILGMSGLFSIGMGIVFILRGRNMKVPENAT
ncbi:MAG TPA: hypothetical protein VK174_17125, partial [Chitinophagales bacterium]|nr:hypothetical protein [Chitinophagales bacterium]